MKEHTWSATCRSGIEICPVSQGSSVRRHNGPVAVEIWFGVEVVGGRTRRDNRLEVVVHWVHVGWNRWTVTGTRWRRKPGQGHVVKIHWGEGVRGGRELDVAAGCKVDVVVKVWQVEIVDYGILVCRRRQHVDGVIGVHWAVPRLDGGERAARRVQGGEVGRRDGHRRRGWDGNVSRRWRPRVPKWWCHPIFSTTFL